MANVLISPLGRSPGAVSGVYFALQKKGIDVHQVVTVGTSHPDVRKAANNYLKPLFGYEKVDYDPIHIPAYELRHTRGSINPYVALVELSLDNAHKGGNQVHVAVTGGRSGMGALAALATNLYGADHLWHLWVDRKIEEGGTVDKLSGVFNPATMLKSPYLNPTVKGEEAYEVVDLPFLDLRPLHSILWAYKRTGQIPDIDSPLVQIFGQAGIEKFRDVFPAGMTFALADRILELRQDYTQTDIQQQAKIIAELGGILREAGIVDEKERQMLIDLVNGQAAPDSLFDLARKVRKDRLGFWKWLGNNKDSIGVALGVAGFTASTSIGVLNILVKALELYLKAHGYL